MFKRDDKLINEYKEGLKGLRAAHRELAKKRYREDVVEHGKEVSKVVDNRTTDEIDDQSLLQSMITDCEYTLFWLEHGYEKPFDDNDFHQLPKYKREQLWGDIDDAVTWQGIASVSTSDQADSKKTELVEQLQEVLSTLSPRELELFKWRNEVMLTESECSEKMGIALGTVKIMSQRIRDKIEDYFEHGYQMDLLDIARLGEQESCNPNPIYM